jgi:Ca2+-binding EF-hand superfamily protein
LKGASELLKQFSKLDTNRDGKIFEKEFIKLLGIPESAYTKELFNLFDENQDGKYKGLHINVILIVDIKEPSISRNS